MSSCNAHVHVVATFQVSFVEYHIFKQTIHAWENVIPQHLEQAWPSKVR